MNSLLFLATLTIIVWFWYETLRYREYAIQRCRKICNEMNLQLLDQTVTLASISFRKDSSNRLRLLRRYNFEISIDGASRHNGYIVFSGYKLIHTEFALPDGPVILQKDELITYH